MTAGAAQALARMVALTEAGGSCACVTLASGPAAGARLLVLRPPGGRESTLGSLGSSALDEAALKLAGAALDDGRAPQGLMGLADDDGASVDVYLETRGPVQELIIVGAGHIARPLCSIGAMLGLRVSVLDDRPDFATQERFPGADRLIDVDFSDPFRDVPLHAGTRILLVTRGHKYDYECLLRIVRARSAPAYVGMIGSRRRVRATFVQLLDDGVPRARIDEIHAPVGLDIGAETPEEIAVAVAAELVKVHRGGTGASLRDVERVAERFFPAETDEEPS